MKLTFICDILTSKLFQAPKFIYNDIIIDNLLHSNYSLTSFHITHQCSPRTKCAK